MTLALAFGLLAGLLIFLGYSLVVAQMLTKHDDDEDLSTEEE